VRVLRAGRAGVMGIAMSAQDLAEHEATAADGGHS
jgi:hypothetical protein